MEIQYVYKFNDGLEMNTRSFELDQVKIEGDFLRSTLTGLRENASITITLEDGSQVTRNYDDLVSLELKILR